MPKSPQCGRPDSRYDLGVYVVKKGQVSMTKQRNVSSCLPILDMMVL